MSWTLTRTSLSTILANADFSLGEEMFSVEKLPSAAAHKSYCLQMDELQPNAAMQDKAGRFFPVRLVRLSVIYELFGASQAAYDAAVSLNDSLVQQLIDPANRASEVRLVSFVGSRLRRFNDQDNWLIVDNSFAMEVTLPYPPA